jgi:sugar O-acyltransferase (sialic acid O-acetyltransferase NeuD family)
MKRIIILGAGGHAQVVADIIFAMSQSRADVIAAGFLDDDPCLWATSLLGIPVLGGLSTLREVSHDGILVAVGDNRTRARITRDLQACGETFFSAIHPRAVIGTGVRIGQGVVICAGVVVNTATEIGDGVVLNTGCTVDHHCRIGAFGHIAPGVHLGGEVAVGEGTFVGIGASVIPRRCIGAWAAVGGGAVVIRDVPDGLTVVGVPAGPIRKNKEKGGRGRRETAGNIAL